MTDELRRLIDIYLSGADRTPALVDRIATEATADLIVMPRSRSSAWLSVWVVPASTLPFFEMAPAV